MRQCDNVKSFLSSMIITIIIKTNLPFAKKKTCSSTKKIPFVIFNPLENLSAPKQGKNYL